MFGLLNKLGPSLRGRSRLLLFLLAATGKSQSKTKKVTADRKTMFLAIFVNFLPSEIFVAEIVDGSPRARRVVCAVDAGFAMHPDGMAAQMESGIIYGLTAALYGDISIHRGAVAQSNFHDYKMVRMNEAPMIETHIINGGETLGGAGEPGTPAIAPALANAVFDATGIRIRELPMNNIDFSEQSPESMDVA